ncbi:MAG: ABC transporter permease [Candidatus Spyradocola sp.]|nr:ABC transporter permease [Candidatus Spyradocola sp.]
MNRKVWATPFIVWMVLFTLAPIVLVVIYSLTDASGAFTLDNFAAFLDPIYINVLLRSIGMALLCTLICLLIAYPAAYFLSQKDIDKKGVLILLFIIPMWMNFLLRTYAWLTLLESNGLITSAVNRVLSWFGVQQEVRLLYNYGAVLMGMVYNYLPFMMLPLYTVLSKMDGSVIEAAEDLGANRLHVFTRVIFPLSLPGVASGITMVFMPAVTTFVISRLLGGAQFKLFGDLIEQQFLFTGNWNFGSAMSLVMMVLLLVSMGIMNRFGDKEGGGVL